MSSHTVQGDQLWHASRVGDVVKVVSLLNSGADVDTVDNVCVIACMHTYYN